MVVVGWLAVVVVVVAVPSVVAVSAVAPGLVAEPPLPVVEVDEVLEGDVELVDPGCPVVVVRQAVAAVARVSSAPAILVRVGRAVIVSGADVVVVAEIAGHRRLETTRRYSLPSDADKDAALEAVTVDV